MFADGVVNEEYDLVQRCWDRTMWVRDLVDVCEAVPSRRDEGFSEEERKVCGLGVSFVCKSYGPSLFVHFTTTI